MEQIIQKDRAYIWHPFTQMHTAPPPLCITQGKGAYLYTAEGKRYLDGISSWWVNLHGHTHPYITQKITAQLKELEHVLFADVTHPRAVDFAARLVPILPGKMGKIFYSDNGSTAVEIALKMALQFWHNQKRDRTKVICFEGGYHGDTFGAMSAAGKNAFNAPFWNHLFDVTSIPPPFKNQQERSLSALREALSTKDAACFLFEPLILGVGGMKIYPARHLDCLLKICHEHEVITIADEVMTGFGRTGTLFASDQLEEKPQIICLSKGITGGVLPLGVTACEEHIYTAFLSQDKEKAFLHGHSYTANPLACTSALASLDLLQGSACTTQREEIARGHLDFCKQWRGHKKLKRCEALGTLLVVEYHTKSPSYFSSLRDPLYQFFLDKGILLRPLGNVLYVLPPYCATKEDLAYIYEMIALTLEGTFS